VLSTDRGVKGLGNFVKTSRAHDHHWSVSMSHLTHTHRLLFNLLLNYYYLLFYYLFIYYSESRGIVAPYKYVAGKRASMLLFKCHDHKFMTPVTLSRKYAPVYGVGKKVSPFSHRSFLSLDELHLQLLFAQVSFHYMSSFFICQCKQVPFLCK